MSHHTRHDILEQQIFVEQRRAAELRTSPSGASYGLSPWLLLALPLIGWIAITELPRTEFWDDYTEWKVAALSAVGLQHLYAAAPVLIPIGWFILFLGVRALRDRLVIPFLDCIDRLPIIGGAVGIIASLAIIPIMIVGYVAPLVMSASEIYYITTAFYGLR